MNTALGRVQNADGEIAVRGQIAWQRPQKNQKLSNQSLLASLLFTGEVRARHVGVQMSGTWPRTNRVAQVRNLNGVVKIDGRTLGSDNLQLTVLDTPLSLNGALSLRDNLQPDALDLVARSNRIDIAQLWPIFAANAPDVSLREVSLRGGVAQGVFRLKGAIKNPQIGGEFSVPNLSVQNRGAQFQAANVRAIFSTDATLRSGSTRFSFGVAKAQTATPNRDRDQDRVLVQTQGATTGSASWSRDAGGSWRAINTVFSSPQIAANARDFSLAARTVQTRIAWRPTTLIANWQTRELAVRSSLRNNIGTLNSANFNGQLTTTDRDSTLRFVAQNTLGDSARWGNGRFSVARGEVSWRALNGATPLQANVAFSNFAARPSASLWAQLKTSSTRSAIIKAQTLRLFLATTNANAPKPVWNGATTFEKLNADSVRNALPAAFSGRVRDLGDISGRARFFNVGGSAPVGSGEFSLSRAVIDDYQLRDLRGRIAFDGDVVTLRNARAQSEAGTLLLDAQLNLRSGASNIGLNVPNVTIPGARLNPFLASSGVRFEGTARGILRVSAGDLSSRNTSPIRVRFDLRLPRAQLFSRTENGNRVLAGDHVSLQNARLRGEGTLQRTSQKSLQGTLQRGARDVWMANGQAQIEAGEARINGVRGANNTRDFRVGNFRAPSWTRGARLENIIFALRGRVRLGGKTRSIALVPAAKRASTLELPTQLIDSDGRGRLRIARVSVRLTSDAQTQIELQNIDAPLLWNGDALQMPRIVAQSSQLARNDSANNRNRVASLVANVTLRNNAWNGEITARDLDAARLQRLEQRLGNFAPGNFQPNAKAQLNASAQPSLLNNANVRGTAFVRAQFSGAQDAARFNGKVDVQARLFNGNISLPVATSSTRRQVSPQNVPVEAALARFSLATQNATARVDELTVWSRGARLSATGNVSSLNAQNQPLDFEVQMNNVRVRDLKNILQIKTPNEIDGVLSGAFRVVGSVQTPRAVGRATLRLARLGEVSLDEATSQVRWENSASGTRLALSEIVARSDKTSVAGDVIADTRRNLWRANLSLSGAPAAQLLRAVEAISLPAKTHSLWPLRGMVRAAVNLSGDFANRNLAAARVADARVEMNAESLRWRGRELGAMTANFNLRDNVLHIEDAALIRQLSAGEIAQFRRAINDVATSSDDAENTTSSTRSSAEDDVTPVQSVQSDVAEVRISGEIPLSSNAPLQLGVRVENERFSVMRDLLLETQRSLREHGNTLSTLDEIISSTRTVPSALEARVGLKAQISGELNNPRIALEVVTDNARLDGQELPSLETSLILADGAIDVNNLELKQTTTEIDEDGKSTRVRETSMRVASGGRIVPGGEISLDVELLRANLSQLAQWIPFLRARDGASMLNGDLSLFSFEVRGKTASPAVTGSIEARDVSVGGTTFDRLRVTTFEIKDDVLMIEPGNFTVVKGGFQSSAAYGSVPWSWGGSDGVLGPRRDGVLDVHLPLQTRDFGALSGAFIPALAEVSAEKFEGSLDITGTLDKPQIAGAVSFQNARFRVDPAIGPFPFGIDKMSGGVRFVDGNRVLVENLRGVIERAEEVRATSTGNAPAAERDPRAARRESSARIRGVDSPQLAGDFDIDGDIELDLEPRRVALGGLRLASHRYNLAMTLKNGAIFSTTYSGLRDVALDAKWKTGDGDPRRAQVVNWTLNARGHDTLSGKLGHDERGMLSSKGDVRLAPDFANSVDALLRSKFAGNVEMKSLPFRMRGVGRATLDGNLKLDNGVQARERNRPDAPARQQVTTRASAKKSEEIEATSATSSTRTTARLANGTTVMTMSPRSFAQIIENPSTAQTPVVIDDLGYEDAPFGGEIGALSSASATLGAAAIADADNPPLRIAGDLTLSQTEVTGLPAGDGTSISTPIGAPFFDVNLKLGRDVRFTTSSLRAELGGELDFTGTPRQPRLLGVVTTRNGQMRFPSATARIQEGEISIDVSRDPVTLALRSRATIDATARGQVGRYQITIVLRGPLDLGGNNSLNNGNDGGQNLRVDVTSNPPLSQDEAFAQLTGTSLRETTGGTNQAYARAVVNLLSAPLFSGLERSLEEAFGLNSLTLDYRLDEPIGVQLGKAIGDRVFVTYRRSLTRGNISQPAYTLRVDVRVKGGVQVGVQTDERGRNQITVEKTIRF